MSQIDAEWQIESVTNAGVRIFLARTGHGRLLGFGHIHSSDRKVGGTYYGFLSEIDPCEPEGGYSKLKS